MALDVKTIVLRWFDEVWNQGREESVDELFSADGVAYGIGETDPAVRGPKEFKAFLRTMRSTLPDVHVTIEDLIVAGDKAVVRIILAGTHKGDGFGVPATGNPVRVSGIIIVRAADGKLVEGWNSWDQLGLLRQLGAPLAQPKQHDRFTAKG